MIVSLLILSKSTLFLSSRLSTYFSLKSHLPRDYPSPSYLSPSSSILSTNLSINPNPPLFPISQLISSQPPRIFANERRESFPKKFAQNILPFPSPNFQNNRESLRLTDATFVLCLKIVFIFS